MTPLLYVLLSFERKTRHVELNRYIPVKISIANTCKSFPPRSEQPQTPIYYTRLPSPTFVPWFSPTEIHGMLLHNFKLSKQKWQL